MKKFARLALTAAAIVVAGHASAQLTVYEHDGFQGRSLTIDNQSGDFGRFGFNDRASSVIVPNEPWELCQEKRFGGRCVVLRPGRYASLGDMGLNDSISSARPISQSSRADDRRDDRRYGPQPAPMPAYDARRRDGEPLFEANVTSVRAVVGAPEQRCWIEREQVQERGRSNVPGAIIGGVIGGILGHQIGGGVGRDLATAGGAVGGAAIGANVNRDGGSVRSQDVQRCSNVQSQGQPQYWDVTYHFRGRDHHVQMAQPPGATVLVNDQGEPRA